MISVALFIILEAISLGQTITINQTEPCFFNQTAGVQIWKNCGVGDDYLDAFLMGWEWVTGGFFSLIIVSIIVLMSYIKYHKVVYPITVGIIFLPVSFFIFPEVFLSFALLMTGIAFGILIWYAFIKQTKEY